MAQSTNDVIPTAICLACLMELGGLEAVFNGELAKAFEKKGKAGSDQVLVSGRTHLSGCDANSARAGARRVRRLAASRLLGRVVEAADYLRDLGIGVGAP